MEEEIYEELTKIYKNIRIEVFTGEEIREYTIFITLNIKDEIITNTIKYIWNGFLSITENIFEIECEIDETIINLYKGVNDE